MKIKSENMNIRQIAESGQCFRMNRLEKDCYSLIAYGKYVELRQLDDETVELSCNYDEFNRIWKDYLDVDYDYGRITAKLEKGGDRFLVKAAEYGKGIRILRQEPFETLISFVISQNKNIPSIKKCIERICERYGERRRDSQKGVYYHTFPLPHALAEADKEDLRELSLGYRDDYIIKAAQAVESGAVDLNRLKECSRDEALKTLKSIRGIGDKVANCVLLYGLHHIEAFPVDVWIKKVLKTVYNDDFDISKYEGYAGIIQQYMFYYMRSLDNRAKKAG